MSGPVKAPLFACAATVALLASSAEGGTPRVVMVIGGNGWIGKEQHLPADILVDEKGGFFYVTQWRNSYVKKFKLSGEFVDWFG